MVMRRIAIVGAGVSGLACARRLVASGHQVKIYDKGRGVGGRAATRRVSLGDSELRFDHGAQYFTVRDPAFRAVVDRLIAAGSVETYPNTVISLTDKERSVVQEEPRFVGVSGMNGFAKGLAQGLDIQTSSQVTRLHRSTGGWSLTLSSEGTSSPFDDVVLAIPAEQAGPLLLPISASMATEAEAAHTAPCWAAMLAFSSPIETGFEAARVGGSSPLAWAAQMKGNDPTNSCWVLHATPSWSKDHIEQPAESVAAELARAFVHLAGITTPPLLLSAHRWRYAQVQTAAGTPFAWDPNLRVGACGDWRLGPRIELAWQSGDALGAAISEMRT